MALPRSAPSALRHRPRRVAPRAWLRAGRRGLRLSFLPPLLVYLASGIAGLTTLVGAFFVKEHLGLSAAFLSSLAFWTGLPWVLKVPLGHLVDLYWHRKHLLVWAGASLIAADLAIMIGLLADPAAMRAWMPAEAWYVLASMLGPAGYVMQDVVADAMTVEAVPRLERDGTPIDEARRAAMHTTMQTLGRMAIVAGGLLVSAANVFALQGVEDMTPAERLDVYLRLHQWALLVPALSVLGVLLDAALARRARVGAREPHGRPRPNAWLLGGGLAFAAIALVIGLSDPWHGPETVFVASALVIGLLMARVLRDLRPEDRRALLITSSALWVFRATPLPGPALHWWMIDELGFDEPFLAALSLVGGVFALAGLVAFRRFLAERPIHQILAALTVAWALLSLPILGMSLGLHDWTAAWTGGLVDARFIALAGTTVESPLAQIAAVPMLAWIARFAPESLKATYFAVMLSFSNLAVQASQLGTRWLNERIVVSREVVGLDGTVVVPADYSRMPELLATTTAIGLAVPLLAIGVAWALQRPPR